MLRRIKGSVDLSGQELAARRAVEDLLGRYLGLHGYEEVSTPVLEDTDLFLRKSGGAIAARMYSFVDQGRRRVSLRPEFTASLMRSYLDAEPPLALPVRWRYVGPVFRYEQIPDHPYRQLIQLGVELIGSSGPRADAEVVSLAWHGLAKLGLVGKRLVLGHVGVVQTFLEEIGLSERARASLLQTLADLRRGATTLEAERAKIEEATPLPDMPKNGVWEAAVESLGEEGVKALVVELLSDLGARDTATRDSSAIVSRFMQRQRAADTPERLLQGLELVGELHLLKGSPDSVLRQAGKLAERHGLPSEPLVAVRSLAERLQEQGIGDGQVVMDLGLARGIAYYTGMVFEIWHDGLGGELPLCGGGRYDGLVRALGGNRDVPALGFAYWLERLGEALTAEGCRALALEDASGAVFITASGEAYAVALGLARELREKGVIAQVDLDGRSLADSIDFARARGIEKVLEVGAAGAVREHLVAQSEKGDPSCCD